MTSFRDVQNLLLSSHGSIFIEDEEFLILNDLFEPRNPDFPHEAYAKFDLDEMAESESLAEFNLDSGKGTFSRWQKFWTFQVSLFQRIIFCS